MLFSAFEMIREEIKNNIDTCTLIFFRINGEESKYEQKEEKKIKRFFFEQTISIHAYVIYNAFEEY